MTRLRLLLCLLLVLCAPLGCKREEPKALYPAGEFSLTSQDGAKFGSAELRGKTWVAAFFFTRCPTICPRLTARMKEIGAQAAERKLPLHLVSISVDPENDTPAVLTEYAKKNGIDTKSWTLLTGDYDAIKKTSVEGFKQALEGKADASAPDYGILHGSHLILVDREGRIRGYYRSSDDAEMKKLVDDAALIAR